MTTLCARFGTAGRFVPFESGLPLEARTAQGQVGLDAVAVKIEANGAKQRVLRTVRAGADRCATEQTASTPLPMVIRTKRACSLAVPHACFATH